MLSGERKIFSSSVPETKKRKLGLDFEESDDEEEDTIDEIKKEVENYRHEKIQNRDEDPLDWWCQRKAKYPHLVKIVR